MKAEDRKRTPHPGPLPVWRGEGEAAAGRAAARPYRVHGSNAGEKSKGGSPNERKRYEDQKGNILITITVFAALAAGCASAPMAVAPVGPNQLGSVAASAGGQLQVFSALRGRTEGDTPKTKLVSLPGGHPVGWRAD
jgi:hypothetical protein